MPSSGSVQRSATSRGQCRLERPRPSVSAMPDPPGLVQRVEHLAEHVELELVVAALPIRTGREPS